ncbi:glycosyltransferase family 2 protein [bacterium]|nr:glycosyltransferase family 2 protein [bacterium]
MSKSAEATEVAVVVNYFTGIDYLESCLRSLCSQDFSFKVYFINNCSKDDPNSIIDKFRGTLDLEYFETSKHLRLYEARNFGVSKTSEKFLTFIDVDDLWKPNYLSTQVDNLVDSGADLVFCGFQLFATSKGRSRKLLTSRTTYTNPVRAESLARSYSVALSGIIFTRHAYVKLGGFDPSLEIIGDFDFVMRAASLLRVVQVPEVLVCIRVHSRSTGSVGRDRQVNELRNWMESVAPALEKGDEIVASIAGELAILELLGSRRLNLNDVLRSLLRADTFRRRLALVRIVGKRLSR